MSVIEKSCEVDVPVRTAYDQWTQFETFPQFMEGVEEVKQLDDKHLHWKAEIAGVKREWDAEIVDQTPDERVTWRAVSGSKNDGTVSFAPAGADHTRVTLRLDFEPEGMMEKAGDMLNVVDRRVEGDLERFKEFIEHRGTETGAWRGDIKPTGEVNEPGTTGGTMGGTTGGTMGGTTGTSGGTMGGTTGTTGTTGTPGTTGPTGGTPIS
ncbi:cyclase [Nocardioides gansuensis]|uniref:Cyclase n=1 Tax=Nocardioides gansuensis TaxID=2138300 RepID=A0A2T8F950_9ACTN|nr:SRPBCC family protein [Nocardioides gansuensis]PVG82256.1 cyclase [Nocardioides gansuensis]